MTGYEGSNYFAGSSKTICGALFSPDGHRFVKTKSDHSVWICDINNGNELVRLDEQIAGLNWVEFSPDGRKLMTSSPEGVVSIWDTKNGRKTATLERRIKSISDAEFGPDGNSIIIASSEEKMLIYGMLKTEGNSLNWKGIPSF